VSAPTGLRITWVGHSTVLIELDGVRLLTDPVLRPRFAHLRRVAEIVDDETLRSLDAVLVSHLHYDHLDVPSLIRLGRSQRLVVPTGAGRLLRRWRFAQVDELARGEETRVAGLTVRATHAEHDSRRAPFGTAAEPIGFLVSGSASVFFAGDTDLFDGMTSLAPDLDVALLPIAGWGPRIPAGHLDPHRAAEALARLRPRVAVPIHWGTYRPIGSRGRSAERPPDVFVRLAAEVARDVDVRVLEVGETLELPAPGTGEAGAAEPAGARR
jgi:L-ascorbate metabolism protein UlaG (beta-lactamase superfamily)